MSEIYTGRIVEYLEDMNPSKMSDGQLIAAAIFDLSGTIGYLTNELCFGHGGGRGPGAIEGLTMFLRDHIGTSLGSIAESIGRIPDEGMSISIAEDPLKR